MTLPELIREARELIEEHKRAGTTTYQGGYRDALRWFIEGLEECDDLEVDDEEA